MGTLLKLFITISCFSSAQAPAPVVVTPVVNPAGTAPLIPESVFGGTMGSVMDMFVAFGANYGNAAADHMASGAGAGASGSVQNIGRYNLRLKRCYSKQGAMTRYFPLTIPPNTTVSAISGYAKINREGQYLYFTGDKKLEQNCVYGVYDVVEDPTEPSGFKDVKRTTGTKWIKLGFIVDKYVLNPNSIIMRYAKTGEKTWDGADFPNALRSSKTRRTCHAAGDICIEASIGTGSNPRFRFEILPRKVKDLTHKACLEKYGGELNWDSTKVNVPVGKCLNSKFCTYMSKFFTAALPETACEA